MVALQILLDASPVGILVLTEDARVIQANALAESLLGRSLSTFDRPSLGEFIACAHHPAGPSDCRATEACPPCALLQATRCALEGESNALNMEGELLLERAFDMPAIWLKYKATRIVLEGRKLSILAIEDITRQKLAERNSQHAQELMRFIIEHANSAIAVHDKALRYLYVSRQYLEAYRVEEKDILGKHHYEVFPDLPQKWRDIHQKVLAGETASAEADPFVRADGSVDWTRWECRPWYAADGTIGGLIVYTEVINEQRRLAMQLAEDERYLRTILQTTADGFWVLDAEGNFLEANAAFLHMSGYTLDELAQMHISDLDVDETPDDTRKRIQRIVANGSERFNATHRSKDGRLFDVEVSVTHLAAKGGQLICFGRDISERKKIEVALRESEAKYRRIAENSADVVWVMDLNLRTTYVSPSVERLLGETVEAFLGKTIAEQLPPASLEKTYAVFKEEMENEQRPEIDKSRTRVIEIEHYTADGGTVWTSANVSFLRDPNGDVVGIQGVSRDITERKKVEEKLRESETQFRSLVTNAPDAIYVEDNTGRILYANGAALRLFGATSPDELRGISIDERFHPDSHGVVREHLRQLHTDKRKVPRHEAVCVRRDGSTVAVELSAVPLVYEEQACALTFLQDVSARKQIEARLRQAQKMEAIGSLAGGIAHDFNNILFPIIGLSEMLLDDLPAEGSEWRNVAAIHQAGQRARELVNQILSFSRQMETRKTPVRLQQVLKEVIRLVQATIPSNITIRYNLQNDCGPLLADPTNLHQIAMNLITNAYHAVEHNSGSIAIELRQIECAQDDAAAMALHPGAYALLTVSDTGHGIPVHALPKIFDPYFTTKPQGKGTGMGLAVCYGIVKEHDGDIRVYSEIDQGTTFNVFLPLMTCDVDVQRPQETVVYPTGSERILLVDDEAPIVRMESQILERLGYRVESRTSSVDALAAFKADPLAFDLVITDMAMPNMTGEQLARQIIAVRPGMPLILCTGFSESMSAAKAHLAGFKDFLMKPLSRGDLAQKVRNVLDAAAKAPS